MGKTFFESCSSVNQQLKLVFQLHAKLFQNLAKTTHCLLTLVRTHHIAGGFAKKVSNVGHCVNAIDQVSMHI